MSAVSSIMTVSTAVVIISTFCFDVDWVVDDIVDVFLSPASFPLPFTLSTVITVAKAGENAGVCRHVIEE